MESISGVGLAVVLVVLMVLLYSGFTKYLDMKKKPSSKPGKETHRHRREQEYPYGTNSNF